MIATTRPAFDVEMLPSDLRNPDRVYPALGRLLGEDEAGCGRAGRPAGTRAFPTRRGGGDLSYDRLASVESHRYALPGVVTDVHPRRDYRRGRRGAPARHAGRDPRRSSRRGPTRAIARASDRAVGPRGARRPASRRDGGRNVVVTSRVARSSVLDEEDPVRGGSVTLTLDLDLQRAAEDAFLPDAVGEPAKMGALVAMDLQTGDILALVSKPSYRPQRLRRRRTALRPGRRSRPTPGGRSRIARSRGSTRPAPPTRR